MRELRDRLAKAKRPLMILGGGGWTAAGRATSAPSRKLRTCRSAARSAARICSTTLTRNYAGDVGIGINPEAGGARARMPIC